jgi:hypothetical protein
MQKMKVGVPSGIRTRVNAVKGQYPRPLDDGDSVNTFYREFSTKSRKKFTNIHRKM